MNKLDQFYIEAAGDILIGIMKNSRRYEKIRHIIDASEDKWTLLNRMNDTTYGQLAKNIADIGLLVCGALEAQNNESNDNIANLTLGEPEVRAALEIYNNEAITPQSVTKTLNSCYAEFRDITGLSPDSFLALVSSAYRSAMQTHGIEVTDKNPGNFLIKTVLRQKIDKNIRNIEDVYTTTSRDDWIEKVESGDVSDYTITVIPYLLRYVAPQADFENENYRLNVRKIGQKLANIDELTELPIAEAMEKGKNTFPNTYERAILSDDEIINSLTHGLNKYLVLLKEYQKQRTEYGDKRDIKRYGKDGCLFGDTVGNDEIILNNKIETLFYESGMTDRNSWCLPIQFLEKITILHLDGYIDFKILEHEWLSSAANEYIRKWTASLTDFLDSEKKHGDTDYRVHVRYCNDELNKLNQFSKTAYLFVDDKSKKSVDAFEKRLKEDL